MIRKLSTILIKQKKNKLQIKCHSLPLHVPPLCPAQSYNTCLRKCIQGEWVNALQNQEENKLTHHSSVQEQNSLLHQLL